MPPRALYRTDQLEIVKRKLPGVLTLTVKEVACLAKQFHPDEVDRLATILVEAPARLHHKWLAQIMGSVPIKAWVTGPDNELYVSAPKEASMRFLSERLPLRERTKRAQLEAFRTELFYDLFSNMTPLKRRFHEPMLALASPEDLQPYFPGWMQPTAETNFGLELLHLEKMFDLLVSNEEQKWVAENAHPTSLTLPNDALRKCSEKALVFVLNRLEQWIREDAPEAEKAPNSMLGLVSANLSANRAMLEYSAVDDRGVEAAKLTEGFLRALNAKGITEVPMEMNALAPDTSLFVLKNLLQKWFSHEGLLIEPSGFFNRTMTDSDINIVVTWAPIVQESYIRSQAASRPFAEVMGAHDSSNNLFIFALALVGAFYQSTRTSHEFTGRSNSVYSVFPGRALHKSNRVIVPPTHALTVLIQTYGLIFFANSDWDLFPDRVIARAETKRIRRAHFQQLLCFMTKGRSSGELVLLHRRLRDARKEFQLAVASSQGV
ncbi:hypothetical protein V2K16_14415 [Pseudomonas alliivorans]|uniref:hypothetical protein n=1 Tax=Pseudomonas alliivorans TaxID=2810613 RepID=UPI001AE9DA8C|nr:hypothetical protein [Pseudomonas alliivorans]MBP0941011.1 hypothetical protein [Pseudomonas alliivorans]MEE4879981.1 hypothetical protein [Pseudomonas alliivorans]MEE4930871.1 hypothetical protein [Pseudomonas alliivorans]MEE4936145.1 hypothetical protein [Pseudomonas alliivorans]MEE4940703.1 hypothetical protein [Pseudomonas alliivorans]